MNVVLISRDHRLGAILTMALPTPEGLTLLGSAAEVPNASAAAIDAVVLDLPADTRRDAYEELRQRYEGRVVVPVDNARDTNDWPPDAKRRFLVRPFQVADLIAGVQEPEETSVAERAARYRRLFRWNRQQAPAFPDLADPATPPAAEQAPTAEAGRFGGPFEAEADADLHNNHVEDQAALVAEDDEDAEVAAEEALVAEDEDEVAAAEALAVEEDEAFGAEAEEPVAVEAAEHEETLEDEDEELLVAEAAEDEESFAAEAAEDEEAETQEFVAVSTQDDEVEAAEQLDAEDEAAQDEADEVEAADDEEPPAEAAEDEEPAVAAAAEAEPVERHTEDWEPSQEDDDLAAAWVAQAGEPLPAGDKELVAAATSGPSTQERAAGLPPPLQVQAGVAMAKAVALQQWLETEEAKRSRGRRRRLLVNVAAGLVLLLAGIGIGMAIGSNEPQQVSPPAAPQPVVQIRDAPPPAACTQAMDDADAVISYLVAKIRDERLSKSIQDYGANARACRRTGRSP